MSKHLTRLVDELCDALTEHRGAPSAEAGSSECRYILSQEVPVVKTTQQRPRNDLTKCSGWACERMLWHPISIDW